jgi:hypothetical protein
LLNVQRAELERKEKEEKRRKEEERQEREEQLMAEREEKREAITNWRRNKIEVLSTVLPGLCRTPIRKRNEKILCWVTLFLTLKNRSKCS